MKKYQDPETSQHRRTAFVFALLFIFFAFLAYRLFSLQCIQREKLRLKAIDRYIKEITIAARRGDIYDRNLRPLAVGLTTYSLYADPSNLEGWDVVAKKISPILNIPEEKLLRKFKSSKYFVWIKRQLPGEVANKIRSLRIKGLGFKEEGGRFYPKGDLAAHVVGFTGTDNVGLSGVEKTYERFLKGRTLEYVGRKDKNGRILRPMRPGYDEFARGYNVVLTIDEVIQNIAENELRRACTKWNARGGSVIIMNPTTGEVLALANYPTFDLNDAFSCCQEFKRNRALRDLYEPGSVAKIITISAAVNEHLFNIDDVIDCENGSYVYRGRRIHDAHPHGLLTFAEVLEESSNIGTVKVGDRLGRERMYHYMEAFGIAGKTGVDLPERAAFLRPIERWTYQSMAAIPFGQEFAVTPLQMLCLVNAVANNGEIMKPFVVRSVIKPSTSHGNGLSEESAPVQTRTAYPGFEVVKQFSPKVSRTPISSDTAATMRQILRDAVEKGTGKNARIDGYEVCGKTGTAQKASSQGGYARGKYVASFVGFLSTGQQTISMIVVIDEPHGSHYGSTVACPVFKEIALQVVPYLTVGQREYLASIRSIAR